MPRCDAELFEREFDVLTDLAGRRPERTREDRHRFGSYFGCGARDDSHRKRGKLWIVESRGNGVDGVGLVSSDGVAVPSEVDRWVGFGCLGEELLEARHCYIVDPASGRPIVGRSLTSPLDRRSPGALLCEFDMLIDVDTGRTIERIPYRQNFEALRKRLSDQEFDAMVARVNELIDDSGAEIATAGWLPGSDWTGTPLEPIYTKAARGDFDRSAMFFGQLVWYAVMNRPEPWGSGRYQADGRDIGSRTYFRIKSGS